MFSAYTVMSTNDNNETLTKNGFDPRSRSPLPLAIHIALQNLMYGVVHGSAAPFGYALYLVMQARLYKQIQATALGFNVKRIRLHWRRCRHLRGLMPRRLNVRYGNFVVARITVLVGLTALPDKLHCRIFVFKALFRCHD